MKEILTNDEILCLGKVRTSQTAYYPPKRFRKTAISLAKRGYLIPLVGSYVISMRGMVAWERAIRIELENAERIVREEKEREAQRLKGMDSVAVHE